MSDIPKDVKTLETTHESQPPKELTPIGRSAIQGDLNWTHQDGTADHYIYERTVEDALDDPDQGIFVWSEDQVSTPQKGNGLETGKIDTRIEHHGKTTLVDYKTNDMSHWTHGEAARYGHEHGQRVQDYVESPDTPNDSKGYLIAVGRQPIDSTVRQTYDTAAAEHGVKVLYPKGGETADVVQSVQDAMNETEVTS